jgi:glutathione S-transferase
MSHFLTRLCDVTPGIIANQFTRSPFVQRVWIAMEAKGLQYQYIEVDPYKKPQALLEVNPRGLVPGIRHGNWGCGESTVLMEYVSSPLRHTNASTKVLQLEDLGAGPALLPVGDPQRRATCRLWADHVSTMF